MRLSNVHFGYEPATPVVRGVTAELRAGQVCALIGPNAAGKSTLIELMLGQLRPTSGAVTLNGKPVGELKPHERAQRLAYVPQRAMKDVSFTVAEVVSLGRYAQPREDAVIDEALAMCDLLPLRGRVFGELSMGQQQRVAVARAVAQVWSKGDLAGKFMLLDEPVNAMDLKHVDHSMQLLGDLASRGLGVLAVLHDLNLASVYADTVWLMAEGQLRAAGRRAEVLQAEVLEPVYGVTLRSPAESGGRRLFFVEPARKVVG